VGDQGTVHPKTERIAELKRPEFTKRLLCSKQRLKPIAGVQHLEAVEIFKIKDLSSMILMTIWAKLRRNLVHVALIAGAMSL
jgi:hypothetical protein